MLNIYEKSKRIGSHSTFKTAGLHDGIYTTLADDFEINFDNTFLYVPIFFPDAATKFFFIDSIKNKVTLSFASPSTDRKTVDTQLECQVNTESAQNTSSRRY